MAAILPHLAIKGETTDLERRYWKCAADRQEEGLSDVPDILCPTPQEVIDQSHYGLLTLAWTRKEIFEQLRGTTIMPKYDKGDVVLVLDKILRGPLWNPSYLNKTTLLSWTSKMGAPSFSISAGSGVIGGSCPAADAGQSVVPDRQRRKVAKRLAEVLPTRVNLANAICQYCYATKDRYPTALLQFQGAIRFAWAKKAVRVDPQGRRVMGGSERCAFVKVMIDAINNADFFIEGRGGKDPIAPEPRQWRGQRFFRIHDSGDFFDLAYLQAWKHVADHFKDIVFWAPTRIWALGDDHVKKVRKINGGGGDNLILRPSGYHVDQRGVKNLKPGWSGSTVVYRHGTAEKYLNRTYDWNCQAYAVDDGPTCRKADGIDLNGNACVGCRTCWMHPDMRVNYTLH